MHMHVPCCLRLHDATQTKDTVTLPGVLLWLKLYSSADSKVCNLQEKLAPPVQHWPAAQPHPQCGLAECPCSLHDLHKDSGFRYSYSLACLRQIEGKVCMLKYLKALIQQ